GDDDQSIYKFRGANIENILSFEKYFPDAKVIRLEENYRSTQNILDAANAVIRNNRGRKAKSLWTRKGEGERIRFVQLDNAYEEAETIAYSINSYVRRGRFSYGDCAVLYRTNAQSRVLEERFVRENIPYRIFGGVNFYARKEIKDLLAYLKTIDNARDDVAVKRIINVPRRGIGATTLNYVQEYADDMGMSFYEALSDAENIPALKAATAAKLEKFVLFIQTKKSKAPYMDVDDLLSEIIEDTGYEAELGDPNDSDVRSRIENIDELISKAADYQEIAEEPSLSGFLEEVALVADIDSLEEQNDYVALMTLHSAKGLEFSNVYLSGMDDGLFPGFITIDSGDPMEMEEERRLCYVGITRAKEQLTLTCARQRMVRGETRDYRVSRFVKEIPGELLSGSIYEREPDVFSDMYGVPYGESRGMDYGQSKSYGSVEIKSYGGVMGKPYGGAAAKPYAAAKSFGDAGKLSSLNYAEGDRVRHMKFGDGTVSSIVSGGRDFEVTVDFDKVGTKKMFASFAKLKKL
ncbi:MAG: UvrD-helicase domain-containing protein, partial [Clostridiales bacterium]|nr:UvrD-helicase domain-containing protein [Clostridiales bacterium]